MKLAATTRTSNPEQMAWDTEFWGVRVGRATHLDGLSEWAIENTIGLVCLLVPTIAEAQAAEERGFRLMDVRVTLSRTPATLPGSARLARAEDTARLCEIARTAFTLTRFYNDPRLGDRRCGELYAEWTRSLCAGAADVVLVIEKQGEAVGYVTVNIDGDQSEIGLIAVREDVRGSMLGTELVRSAIDWARASGAMHMSVATQGANVGALRTFEGSGFRVSDVSYWLHRWAAE